VIDWNTIAIRAMQVSPAVPGFLQQRTLAIVHASVFDAVNGIGGRYHQIHVPGPGPSDGSQRAAAVQAAYRALVGMFPAQQAALDADLATSLAVIALTESPEKIQLGRDWGNEVALAILAWRAGDNPAPPMPYVGSTDVGKWRPTPPAFANGAAPLLGSSPGFVIPSVEAFRSKGPPALTSFEYARDVNEVKLVGKVDSAERTADQTQSAQFWAGAASSVWNRAAQSASIARGFGLYRNARLFALLNLSTADTTFSTWDNKYHFEFWRPVTAIQLADTDSNPRTTADPAWLPLIATPPYPEYDSGHQGVSGAAQQVLTRFFGRRMGFEGFSEGLPGVVRSWDSFAEAANEAFIARIWSGIHFRFAMRASRMRAEAIANYILMHAAQPVDMTSDVDSD
jgi:hypothetical protein